MHKYMVAAMFAAGVMVLGMATVMPVPASLLTTAQAADDSEKSGCCSSHGGVCGCEGGRIVCCDGAFSPTCTC